MFCSLVPANWPTTAWVMWVGGWMVSEYRNIFDVVAMVAIGSRARTALEVTGRVPWLLCPRYLDVDGQSRGEKVRRRDGKNQRRFAQAWVGHWRLMHNQQASAGCLVLSCRKNGPDNHIYTIVA